MMLGRNWETFWRPSSPSAADSVRKPHVRTNSVRPERAALSSSTISTRSEPCCVWRSTSVKETVVLMSPLMTVKVNFTRFTQWLNSPPAR